MPTDATLITAFPADRCNECGGFGWKLIALIGVLHAAWRPMQRPRLDRVSPVAVPCPRGCPVPGVAR